MEIVFVIIAVLVIAFAIYGHFQAEKRKHDLRAWAEARGWEFQDYHDHDMERRYARFACLQKGSQRYAYNIMCGQDRQFPIVAFDYHYETYSTDSKGRRRTHHHHFSAVIVETDLPLKPLYIRNETFLDKIGQFFGFDDINFELAEFSREFHVSAPDRRWAYDVLHQEAMEFLLRAPRFTLELQPRRALAYRGQTFSVADFEAAMTVVTGLIERMPTSVVRELKGEN
ncbi:MAG: hypothetical protein ACK4RK_19880 [Gemmataceae bacterium]